MQVETTILAQNLVAYAEQARRLEEIGYDSVVTPEAGHDPFLPLTVVAEHTQKMKFGTAVAIAFPRSPMVTAQLAWDLQRFSGGRFILGLGTQVKGHNERRYSTPWPSPPGPRFKDYILTMKAIFKTFQEAGSRPTFHTGPHYQFNLIAPFFNPGPNADGHVPIYISAVNRYNCRLVGEVCDGIRMHGFNTTKYTKEVILPEIEAGARKAGRKLSDIDIVGGSFIITGKNEEEVERAKAPVRQQLSFYASTRAYHPVLEVHGWQDAGQTAVPPLHGRQVAGDGKGDHRRDAGGVRDHRDVRSARAEDQAALRRCRDHARLRLRHPHAGGPRAAGLHRPGAEEGVRR